MLLARLGAVDLTFLLLMAFSVILGGVRGVSRQMLSWISWISIFFLAYYYAEKLADLPILQMYIANYFLRYLSVLSIIFVMVLVVSMFVNFLVKHILSMLELNGIDMILGVGFGVLQGGLLFLLLVAMMKDTTIKEESWWKSSLAVQASLEYVMPHTHGLFALAEGINERIDAMLLPVLLESAESAVDNMQAVANQSE